jgi:hypothetical protein
VSKLSGAAVMIHTLRLAIKNAEQQKSEVARKYSVFCGKPVKVEIAKTGTYASTV